MSLESLQDVLTKNATRDQLATALATAVDEIIYLRRIAVAYKETAEGRIPNAAAIAIAGVALSLSNHTERRVDDPASSGEQHASCWLVSETDMSALRDALKAWREP